MHTTASDGRLAPAALVARAAAAGLTTISVTDHDTCAAIAEVTTAGAAAGIRVVPGIEITAVVDGRDVHMLGYFFDADDDRLLAFLVAQRERRVSRAREIAARLSAANLRVDIEGLIQAAAARPGSSVARPLIAREMVRAGHVGSVQEAFDVWLASGRPAFVPRTGPDPAEVIGVIHDAGGVASFAHPAVTKRDDLIEPLVSRGLDAIEVYHSDHNAADTSAYRRMAGRFGTLVSGGSDFHGDDPPSAEATGGKGTGSRSHRSVFGVVVLPPADFAGLEEKAASASAFAKGFGETGSGGA